MKQSTHNALNLMDRQDMINMFESLHMMYDGDSEDEIREELRELAIDDTDVQEMIDAQD